MSLETKHFYDFENFRIDPDERVLLREGKPVPLTPKAFQMLMILVENHGHIVDKEKLLSEIWADSFVEEGNLSVNARRLRQALADDANKPKYIETIARRGYRFIADVRCVESDDRELASKDERPAPQLNGKEAASDEFPHPLRRSESKRAGAVVALADWRHAVNDPKGDVQEAASEKSNRLDTTIELVRPTPSAQNKGKRYSYIFAGLLLLSALLVALNAGGLRDRLLGLADPHPVRSLAVLPLENLSGDPAQEYFTDGMTDALIGDLAKIGELRVISRTSSMHYKGTKKSLPEIAAELNVDAVVGGTVQRVGERVRIRVQLIHAATDRHLWAETYERDLRDVLDLQSEIARSIAREVQIKTTPDEQARLSPRRPVHPRALEEYLQGRYLYFNKRTEENLRKAIEHFQTAVKEDPTYASAYAGMADCYKALAAVQFSVLSPDESRRRAEEAAEQALKLDSGLAEAHSALGVIKHYNWDWDAAERGLKRAIELNPNYALAHMAYADYLMSRGRVEESLAAADRARELDPLSLAISVQRGFQFANARRYDEAIQQLRRVIALDPNHYQAHWFLGHVYAFNGQHDEAVAASEKAVSLSGRAPGALGMLGLVYGLAGRKDEAAEVLNELLELNERRYVTPTAVAWVYIGLGDKDKAFVWLEKAYQEHSYYIAYLKANPIADSLHSDPRFADLVRRVGLPQ